mgnify:CR=1 FL=1
MSLQRSPALENKIQSFSNKIKGEGQKSEQKGHCNIFLSFFFSLFSHVLKKRDVILTTLKPCLGVLPVLLILGLREYSWKSYTTFVGVLP